MRSAAKTKLPLRIETTSRFRSRPRRSRRGDVPVAGGDRRRVIEDADASARGRAASAARLREGRCRRERGDIGRRGATTATSASISAGCAGRDAVHRPAAGRAGARDTRSGTASTPSVRAARDARRGRDAAPAPHRIERSSSACSRAARQRRTIGAPRMTTPSAQNQRGCASDYGIRDRREIRAPGVAVPATCHCRTKPVSVLAELRVSHWEPSALPQPASS